MGKCINFCACRALLNECNRYPGVLFTVHIILPIRSPPPHPHASVHTKIIAHAHRDWQLSCPSNTGSAEGAGSAVDCSPLPGFYGDRGNAASSCPTGFYCTGGSAVQRCPVGTTSAMEAATVAQCSVMRSYYGRLA